MPGRSYGQFCGLARALDAIGDRWSLLIVRELLVDARRYSELQKGLPGIASNLLADRLRQLEANGVLERQAAPPTESARYGLTAWGHGLREPIDALIRWSTPLMAAGADGDHFEPRWLVVALNALLQDRSSTPPRTANVTIDGQTIRIRIAADGPHVDLYTEPKPGVSVEPEILLALAAGTDSDMVGTPNPPGDQLAELISALTPET